VTTYLNVPFNQKADAKAKGARWDSEARKWFVPMGRELEPCASWLPVDPAKLASQDLAEVGKGVPLSHLLAGVATVARACAAGTPGERRDGEARDSSSSLRRST
jgi:exodeoxyribonuclease VII large subunit